MPPRLPSSSVDFNAGKKEGRPRQISHGGALKIFRDLNADSRG